MNPNDDPETLERRSESIRADVGETLDALQRNYSPGALVDRSMNLLRDHGGDMATTIVHAVRRNPMPALLIGAGVAWMIAAQLRSRGEEEGTTYETGSFDEDSQESDEKDATQEMSGNRVGGHLAGAREKLRTAATGAAEKVSEGARRVGARARSMADGASDQSRRAGEEIGRLIEEQRFIVGAAGIAIGALIGALLPESAKEDRLLGPARDRMLRKVRSAGEQGLETAREKVHEAVDRAKEAVRDAGSREDERAATAPMSSGPNPVI